MAIPLSAKPNVSAPAGNYPYGNMKDNTGSGDGTPVNKIVYADFHQFFARLLAMGGVAANGLPDNNADGFQYFQALQNVINNSVSSLLELIGDLDASANPNYPAANKGDTYLVTVAGKVGGAAGKNVDVGDLVVAKANNAGGNEAAVGASWFVLERNLEKASQAGTDAGVDDITYVTPLKIKNGTSIITTNALVDAAVTTAKIGDNQVTILKVDSSISVHAQQSAVADLDLALKPGIQYFNGTAANSPVAGVGNKFQMIISRGDNNGDVFQTAICMVGNAGYIYSRNKPALGAWSAWATINDPTV